MSEEHVEFEAPDRRSASSSSPDITSRVISRNSLHLRASGLRPM